ncbi:hypothetical protein KBC86_01995 [Candidatus Gracilibacteria bacterium]|nr:hypothetical protein [Candidatus Gracilibacteria bacterium]
MSSPETPKIPEILSENGSQETTSFLTHTDGNGEGQKVDNAYTDFFQETSDGKISVGSKARQSGLELSVSILGYVLIVVVVASILGTAHVFLRNQESGKMIESYPFLCNYLNYGINLDSQERGCKTLSSLATEYNQKRETLEDNIIVELNSYIPLKITQNILRTSPEKKFIIDTYNQKLHVNDIMDKFDSVKRNAQASGVNNIDCNGMSITGDGKISTQCTIYGGNIGSDDTNGKMGSARIEALRFIENLSATNTSGFIVLNPPSSLSIEKTDGTSPLFQTRTTLSIQAQYVNFSQKP